MKLEKVDHVSISVKKLDETLKFYTDILGVKKSDIQVMELPGVVKIATLTVSGSKIEFLEFLNQNDPLAKLADPKAEALHHIAIKVDDIEATLAAIKKQGGTLLNEKPNRMPNGVKVAFAQPAKSKVLIEFMED